MNDTLNLTQLLGQYLVCCSQTYSLASSWLCLLETTPLLICFCCNPLASYLRNLGVFNSYCFCRFCVLTMQTLLYYLYKNSCAIVSTALQFFIFATSPIPLPLQHSSYCLYNLCLSHCLCGLHAYCPYTILDFLPLQLKCTLCQQLVHLLGILNLYS